MTPPNIYDQYIHYSKKKEANSLNEIFTKFFMMNAHKCLIGDYGFSKSQLFMVICSQA